MKSSRTSDKIHIYHSHTGRWHSHCYKINVSLNTLISSSMSDSIKEETDGTDNKSMESSQGTHGQSCDDLPNRSNQSEIISRLTEDQFIKQVSIRIR